MKTILALLVVALAFVRIANADEPQKLIGKFSNVRVIEQEGDCIGREVILWKTGTTITGTLKMYEGDCEEKGLPIFNVHYDSASKSLSFNAVADRPFEWQFEGHLTDAELKGKLFRVHPKVIEKN